jgi:hypothetical protein
MRDLHFYLLVKRISEKSLTLIAAIDIIDLSHKKGGREILAADEGENKLHTHGNDHLDHIYSLN